MRLKSFYARTMTEAMQMVRDTLGEDAVIVATREDRKGKTVHVTAAIDPAFEISSGDVAGGDSWLQYDGEDEERAVAEPVTDALLRHAVPEEVMDQVISCATIVGLGDPRTALMAALEHLYNFVPLPQGASRKPLMAVGAPGSGKTLAIAKMAARGAMAGLKIGVITADVVRAGGAEQLEALMRLLRVPVVRAQTPQDLRHVAADMQGCDQILIDTAGLNPFDTAEIKTLAQMISSTDAQAYMVLPGGTDAEEAGEMARVFATIGARGMIPSRIDIARRLGGLLAASHFGGLSFADAANTPKVAEGLISMTPATLARFLMPGTKTASAARPSNAGRTPAKSASGQRVKQ